jgi:hypothetical protein
MNRRDWPMKVGHRLCPTHAIAIRSNKLNMENIMIKLALALVVGLGLGLHPPQQDRNDIKVYQYTSSSSYYGEWYTQAPSQDATRVYFQGEPIEIQVQMHNEGGAAVSITNVNPVIGRNFRLEVLAAPNEKAKNKLKQDFTPTFERIPVTGRISSLSPSATIRLGAKESLVAKFTIKMNDGGFLPEGIYRCRIKSLLKAASRNISQNIMVNNDDFTFEVRRVRSVDDRIEVLRREATEAASSDNNPDIARQKINELLKMHPNSDAAYRLLGNLEYRLMRLKPGIAAYEKALELLSSGKDTIVSKYKTKLVLEEAQGIIYATLRAWKQEQK